MVDLTIKVIIEAADSGMRDNNQLADAVNDALDFASPVEFHGHMRILVDLVCSYIISVDEKRENGLISNLLNYMEHNYSDSGLSLDRIASQFGYSIYYWSRFFKEKIGCHFTDHLWRLRVTEAKRQFVTTNKMLKDIVHEVGYTDLTSFSRKFKNEEGITPSQFRKLYAVATVADKQT
jgi:YesN/AraC family two-component response regulator